MPTETQPTEADRNGIKFLDAIEADPAEKPLFPAMAGQTVCDPRSCRFKPAPTPAPGQVVHVVTRVVSTFYVCNGDGTAAEPFEHAVEIKELKPEPFADLHGHLVGVKDRATADLMARAMPQALAPPA